MGGSGEDPAEARSRKSHSLLQSAAQAVSAALVAAPKDNEVCFSPEEPCDVKLLKFVESARASIDIAIYDINRDSLVHALLMKARELPVRVLVDQRQAKGGHSLVMTLVKGGVSVRFGRQRGIMHNKFTIVDQRMIETGSFNYTNHASEANNENQIYLAGAGVVARYRSRFEDIWARGKPADLSRGVANKQ